MDQIREMGFDDREVDLIRQKTSDLAWNKGTFWRDQTDVMRAAGPEGISPLFCAISIRRS